MTPAQRTHLANRAADIASRRAERDHAWAACEAGNRRARIAYIDRDAQMTREQQRRELALEAAQIAHHRALATRTPGGGAARPSPPGQNVSLRR